MFLWKKLPSPDAFRRACHALAESLRGHLRRGAVRLNRLNQMRQVRQSEAGRSACLLAEQKSLHAESYICEEKECEEAEDLSFTA
jgi:hypothetical protein